MPVQIINALNTIDPETETHYAYHRRIDTKQYPQVHDFYEIDLVTSGKMGFTIAGKNMDLVSGSLILVRPGDIHAKTPQGESTHINLAFPAAVVNQLFVYINDAQAYTRMLSNPYCPPVMLSTGECGILQQKLTKLGLIPPDKKPEIRTRLRILLAEVIHSYLIDMFRQGEFPQIPIPPLWLREALKEMEKLSNLSAGIAFLQKQTGKTTEHICRSFRKYLNITATDYINSLRLNYAANMLLHSDRQILDIAWDVGFENISHFYHLFKQAFHISPRRFRENSLSP
jgi:AraC family cel operon transcriptional repressor